MGRKNIETSIEAFHSLKSEEMRKTYLDIIWALSVIKTGTFENIATFLKCSPGKIWRRLGELESKYNLIHRPGEKKPLKSGRNGFVWKLNSDTPIVERPIPGKTVSDYSKAFNQPAPSNSIVQTLF